MLPGTCDGCDPDALAEGDYYRLPIMRSRPLRFLIGLLVVTAGCGGEDDQLAANDDVTTSVERTEASVVYGTDTPGTAAPPLEPRSAECTDPAGDAEGGADLVKVTLAVNGPMLTATYELGGDVGPSPDGASWLIVAKRGSGDSFESYQLGFKMVGNEVFRFFADLSAGQQNFDTPYTAEGSRVVASFPLSALDKLRGEFSWNAVTTFAGNDTDQCPAETSGTFTL